MKIGSVVWVILVFKIISVWFETTDQVEKCLQFTWREFEVLESEGLYSRSKPQTGTSERVRLSQVSLLGALCVKNEQKV